MPIVVEAKPEAEYQQWIAAQKAENAKAAIPADKTFTKEELMKHGEEQYNQTCAMCHKGSGEGLPPTFPSLVGSAIVTKPDHITEHIRQLIYGKNAMPPFAPKKVISTSPPSLPMNVMPGPIKPAM